MAINSSSYSSNYTATYFREIHKNGECKEVEIELKYLFTMPEGVFVERLYSCFQKALEKNSGFVVLVKNDLIQKKFTAHMLDAFRGHNFQPEELDLNSIMVSIWKKSKMQMDHELEIFNLQEEMEHEKKCQELAEAKCNQLLDSSEILTRRQVQHLVAVVRSFGRRKGSLVTTKGKG